MSSNTGQYGGVIGARYGEALLQLAEEAGQLEEVAGEVREVEALIQQQPDLERLLSSRILSMSQREEALKNVFGGRINKTFLDFMRVVNNKERLDQLPAILRQFLKLLDERRGIIEVDVFIAARLDDGKAKDVAARIGQALGREVVLHQYVDPELIGGLKIRVGDQLIDGSVATQLKRMKEKLIEAGREKARAGA